jgi:hypothetical protein
LTEEIIYENMQVEWDIKIIGTSIGGMGVRVPGGRFYSGYVFFTSIQMVVAEA